MALQESITLGRHLENDVLLSGEDVLDYHLRIEPGPRGPRAIPLADASLRVNGLDLAQPVGLMPGDLLEIGQNRVRLVVEPCTAPAADAWALIGPDGAAHPLTGVCRIGRGEDNDLQVQDDHVSRHHATLALDAGMIWLRDLGSANGTYVNGQRLSGACRLFHGDEVLFDTIGFQLVGEGADLTPVRKAAAPADGPLPLSAAGPARDAAGSDTTEVEAAEASPVLEPTAVASAEAGAFLLGASDPVAGMTFRTPVGRTLIGRQDGCDVVIRDRTVSSRHAELMVRSDGVTITNMMSTNGTRVNGQPVQTARLHDGDVLRLGRVSLVFKDVPVGGNERPWLRRLQLALLLGSLVLALSLIVFLL